MHELPLDIHRSHHPEIKMVVLSLRNLDVHRRPAHHSCNHHRDRHGGDLPQRSDLAARSKYQR